jgi:Mg2+ and Co2+ transporter CorA
VKSVHKYGEAAWIDLKSPTPQEIDTVIDEYGIDVELGKRLLMPSIRHAVEFGEQHAYVIFHFPAFRETEGDAAYEIDFVIGKNFVITSRYGDIQIPDAADLSEVEGKNHRDTLFFGILESLVASYEDKLVNIDHWIRSIEEKIFQGREKESIVELSEASRHLIDFKKITAVYPDSIATLKEEGKSLFGKGFADKCDEVLVRLEKAKTKLDTLTEAAHELRETNYSLLSTKQNELIKILSIISVVIAVLVGIALIWIGLRTIK